MDVWTDLLCKTYRSCPFEFCCAFVQGSLSCLPQSCWIVGLLQLVWTHTSTKPTPGCLKRKMLPSASLKTHQRRMSKASLEASRASWGAPWFPRLSEQIRLLSILSLMTAMHSFYCLFLFSPTFSFVGTGKAWLRQSPYHQVPKNITTTWHSTKSSFTYSTVLLSIIKYETDMNWTAPVMFFLLYQCLRLQRKRKQKRCTCTPIWSSNPSGKLNKIWPQIPGALKYHHVLSLISLSVPYICKAPFKQIKYNLKCLKNKKGLD